MELQTKFYTVGQSVVCVVIGEGIVRARGVAACSPLDKFDYSKGKKKAHTRAKIACLEGISLSPIIPRRFHSIKDGKVVGHGIHLQQLYDQGITHKIAYEPTVITKQEKAILARLREKEN